MFRAIIVASSWIFADAAEEVKYGRRLNTTGYKTFITGTMYAATDVVKAGTKWYKLIQQITATLNTGAITGLANYFEEVLPHDAAKAYESLSYVTHGSGATMKLYQNKSGAQIVAGAFDALGQKWTEIMAETTPGVHGTGTPAGFSSATNALLSLFATTFLVI